MDPYLFVLKTGEAIVPTLLSHVKKMGWPSCALFGIGAVINPEIAYYNLETREYQPKKFTGMYEVISLTGNVCVFEGEFKEHLHICMGGEDYATLSGHFVEGTVGPTLELLVTPLKEQYTRQIDKQTGLKLIK